MTDKRTQNIKQFLSELSGKALAYLFPGVDKETIGEQSHRYLKEYPLRIYRFQRTGSTLYRTRNICRKPGGTQGRCP